MGYNRGVNILSKQRTREHIIADLSVNHAERAFLLAGYTSNRFVADYGYDLFIATFDDSGYAEPDLIYVQMKSSDAPEYLQNGDFITVRVDDRDDAMWRRERNPVALIMYDAARDVAFYLDYQTLPQSSRRSVRIPTTNRFDIHAAQQLRAAKNDRLKGF